MHYARVNSTKVMFSIARLWQTMDIALDTGTEHFNEESMTCLWFENCSRRERRKNPYVLFGISKLVLNLGQGEDADI